MHRLMMTSRPPTGRLGRDAGAGRRSTRTNALYSRMPLTRLDAEALYDSLLARRGPARRDAGSARPTRCRSRADGLVTPVGTEAGLAALHLRAADAQAGGRRTLENFDFPQMNPNCFERRDSTVAPQALHLMNNGMIQPLAESFARRVQREAGDDPARQVERVYVDRLRPPPERRGEGGRRWTALATVDRRVGRIGSAASPDRDRGRSQGADDSYCHAIMNSASVPLRRLRSIERTTMSDASTTRRGFFERVAGGHPRGRPGLAAGRGPVRGRGPAGRRDAGRSARPQAAAAALRAARRRR